MKFNIKSFHNSIIGLFCKSGRKNKEIRKELIAFTCIKVISDLNKTILTEEYFNAIAKEITFIDVETSYTLEIIETLNKYSPFEDKEAFKAISTLIDDISTIYNPKHGQHYTNESMALLSANLLVKDVSWNDIITKDEITIYEPSAGTGNLIFPLVAKLIENGVSKDRIKVYANEFDDEAAFILEMLLRIKDIRNEVKVGDALLNYFTEQNGDFKKFDFVVSNPPFGVSFSPEELIKHEVYSKYIIKNKLQIAKASNSLMVFIELVRSSFKISSLIIGNDCDFSKAYKNEKNSNSVLGNIINDAQLNTLIKQSGDMFVNTNISTNMMLLTHDNEDFSYVDADSRFLYTSGLYSISKMKNGYSKENISKILQCTTDEKKIKYGKNTLIDNSLLSSSYAEIKKDTLSTIKKIEDEFEYSLDELTKSLDILTMGISNESILNKICLKKGTTSEKVLNIVSGDSDESVNNFMESVKRDYNVKDIRLLSSKEKKYSFLLDECRLEIDNIGATKENRSFIEEIYKDIETYNKFMKSQELDLDNILNGTSINEEREDILKNKNTTPVFKSIAVGHDTNLLDFI